MKLFLIIPIFLILFCSVTVQAQDTRGIKWGLFGSLSNTNVGYFKPFSRNSITGYKAGLFVSKSLNYKYEFSLMIGLSRYGQRSYNSTRIIVMPNYDSTFYSINKDVFTFVNVSPKIRYYPFSIGSFIPFLGFGFMGGYLLKSKNFLYNNDGQLKSKLNQTSGFYKINYGVNVEIGTKIKFNKPGKSFLLSFSYEPGLANIIHTRSMDPKFSYKTNAINLNIFIPF